MCTYSYHIVFTFSKKKCALIFTILCSHLVSPSVTNTNKICLKYALFLGALGKVWKTNTSFFISVRPSVRLSLDGLSWTLRFGYISKKKKTIYKIQFSLKSDQNNGTLHEDQYTFLIISRSFVLRMKNVSDKNCRKIQNTHFVFSNLFS